jgi:hypothetical protein
MYVLYARFLDDNICRAYSSSDLYLDSVIRKEKSILANENRTRVC